MLGWLHRKAAEHRRTPQRKRKEGAKITATFWSAAVLCRFEWALDYCERVEPLTQIRFSFRGNRDVSDEGDINDVFLVGLQTGNM